MSLSVKATVGCNLGCIYCYESTLRNTGKLQTWELDAILRAMEEQYRIHKTPITFHGGEPLLLPKDQLEVLFRKAYELAGRCSIQTNGVNIDDDIIRMFKRYNVHPGISVDGPWPLNKLRVGKDGLSGREATERTVRNIYRLKAAGIQPGLIIVLHRANALPEPREKLKEWLLELKGIGINSGRLNLAEVDYPEVAERWALTEEEAREAYLDLARFVLIENDGLYWQPFRDVVDLLMGLGSGTCIFGPSCDYFNAVAERVINGDGSLASCLKTAKTGHAYLRIEGQEPTSERYQALFATPQEYGGCKGCRYWKICAGVCPAEGIDGDWRNRSRYCEAYKAVYQLVERHLKRLMPNLELVVDKPAETWDDGWDERRSNRVYPPAVRWMTPQYTTDPSTWRGSAKQKERKQTDACQRPGGVQGSYHGDRPHGDHSDHADA